MKFRILSLILICISGADCATSLPKEFSAVCEQQLPALAARFVDARVAMGPWAPRSLASVYNGSEQLSDLSSEQPMAVADQKSWQKWAQEQLVEVEHEIDWSRAHVNRVGDQAAVLSQSLSDIANQLVYFHGYAQLGSVSMMAHSLDIIAERAKRAVVLACGSPTPQPETYY